MPVFSGLYGSTARFVRAQTIAEAKHILRASFGFSPRGFVRLVADNYAISIGSALVYDEAANKIDGANHRALKAARVKSRAKFAAGKGAPMPAGVEILTM